VDNLSPFTPDIVAGLDQLGFDNIRVEYSKVSSADLAGSGRVILSGRRKNKKEINSANSAIIRHCFDSAKPLLGICYGAEIIALTLGGTIRKMPAHMQGQMRVSVDKRTFLTGDKNLIDVYESHAFCIARLPSGFVPLASSDSCKYEIFTHTQKPIFGTQFHPEKSGSDGAVLLERFAGL
jgi:GMP synthase (glutamine-hydrolysing)